MDKQYVGTIIKVIIWIVCLYASTFIHLHSIFFILTCFYLIFTNLAKERTTKYSAYSVFNQGYKRIPGTFDAEEFISGRKRNNSNDYLNAGKAAEQQLKRAQALQERLKNSSRYANTPCICNSGIKFKKCCLLKYKSVGVKDGDNKLV